MFPVSLLLPASKPASMADTILSRFLTLTLSHSLALFFFPFRHCGLEVLLKRCHAYNYHLGSQFLSRRIIFNYDFHNGSFFVLTVLPHSLVLLWTSPGSNCWSFLAWTGGDGRKKLCGHLCCFEWDGTERPSWGDDSHMGDEFRACKYLCK